MTFGQRFIYVGVGGSGVGSLHTGKSLMLICVGAVMPLSSISCVACSVFVGVRSCNVNVVMLNLLWLG